MNLCCKCFYHSAFFFLQSKQFAFIPVFYHAYKVCYASCTGQLHEMYSLRNLCLKEILLSSEKALAVGLKAFRFHCSLGGVIMSSIFIMFSIDLQMRVRLSGGHFRMLNEKLYTCRYTIFSLICSLISCCSAWLKFIRFVLVLAHARVIIRCWKNEELTY